MSTETIYQTTVKLLKKPFSAVGARWSKIPREARARVIFLFISFLLLMLFSVSLGTVLSTMFAIPVYIVTLSTIAFYMLIVGVGFLITAIT